MAVAPNANIGLVAGTTPGMDPRFAQVFSRNKISGKYMDINQNLVKDLKNMGIWEKVRGSIIESQGDISNIDEIPQHIKDVYKTSFTTSPYAFIEVAARAQKWIDQAISRNMYLETRDIDETMKIYTAAWEKGVKTTYYLHMKPRHTAEQSTVRVNKAEKMGKVGFAAVSSAMGEKKAAFDAPLQKSLDIIEPAPMVVPAAPVIEMKAEPVQEQFKAPLPPLPISWSIPKAEAKMALKPEVKAEVKTEAKAGGYQSLADLASSVSTKSPDAAQSDPSEKDQSSFKMVNGRRVFASSDPSEDNICDSCQ